MPLIGSYHQSTGHSGPAIMQRLLQRDYKWPGMWTDIRTYYSRCNLCSVYRERCDKPPPTEMLQARLPNEVVAMDIVGPPPPFYQRPEVYFDCYGPRYLLGRSIPIGA